MNKLICISLSACLAYPSQARADDGDSPEGRAGVLELRNLLPEQKKKEMDRGYFTDRVRAAALKAMPALNVMTRENLEIMLEASHLSLEECEANCEVATGQKIGADVIISGELLEIAGRLKIALRLHETKTGRLLAAVVASGANAEELDGAIDGAVAQLLVPLRPAVPGSQVSSQSAKENQGFITIVSQPRAKVLLDGAAAGATPIRRMPIDPGTHLLVLNAKGYSQVTRSIEVRPGQELPIFETLREQGGFIELSAAVPGAILSVDGKTVREGRVEVRPGAHVVRAELDNYQEARQSVTLEAGQSVRVRLSPTPLAGQVVVLSPQGTLCRLDGGAPVQLLPNKPAAFPAEVGQHRLDCTKIGFEPFNQSVSVVPGRAAEVGVRQADSSARARGRTLGYVLGSVAVAGLGVGAFGFAQTISARDALRAQAAPTDLSARQALYKKGQTMNALGVAGIAVGAAAAAASLYFFAWSF